MLSAPPFPCSPLLWLLVLPCLVNGEVYYVTPTANTSCPDEPCLTISEYAAQPHQYFNSTTTMLFLEGEHLLSTDLSFKNFSMVKFNSIGVASIICLDGAHFAFMNAASVGLSNLELLGCNGNVISNVHQFVLHNCNVQGLANTLSEGLQVFNAIEVLELLVDDCSFAHIHSEAELSSSLCSVFRMSNCSASLARTVFHQNSAAIISGSGLGSVICAFNSNLTITASCFANNTGVTGGVLHAESSNVTALETSFTGNHASWCGGVMHMSQTSLSIDGCAFDENNSDEFGGVLCVALESTLDIQHSTFVHNTALDSNMNSIGRGGVLHLTDNCTASFYNCSFSENIANTSGVIYARNNTWVSLIYSTFTNNRALSPRAYLGYGAVISTQTNCFTLMRGCTFRNNSATSGGGCANIYKGSAVTISDSNLFEDNRAKDGGAFTVWASSIVINGCTRFVGNTAEHGGALNIIENSTAHIHSSHFESNSGNRGGAILARTNTTLILTNTSFHGNHGISDYAQSNLTDGKGGSIFAQYASVNFDGSLIVNGSRSSSGVMYFTSCNVSIAGDSAFSDNQNSFLAHNSDVVFTGNAAFCGGTSNTTEESGAITAVRSIITFRGHLLLEDNCGRNGGAVLAIESTILIYATCTFNNNSAVNGGAVYAYKSELLFKGNVNFRGNKAVENGGGLFAVGTTIRYYSNNNLFLQNTAKYGGAVYFDETSNLYIVKEDMECTHSERQWYCTNVPETWLKLVFDGNHAFKKGGAIYVTDTDASTCDDVPFETSSRDCFIQTVAVYESANDWDTDPGGINLANIVFTSNLASDGSLLYGGLLDRCAVDRFAEVQQILKYTPDPLAYFSDISVNTTFTQISSDPTRICFCENETVNCALPPPFIDVKRGQSVYVSLAVINQVSKPVNGCVKARLSSTSSRLGRHQSEQVIKDTCSILHYNVYSAGPETLYLYPEGPCADRGISRVEVNINVNESCPVGFSLSNSSLECVCDPDIRYITNCSIDTESIVREGNYWISSMSDENSTSIVAHGYCPYDYCYPSTDDVLVNLNKENGSDAQCAFHRSGRLCGSCPDGYSLTLGSSKCERCSNYWLLLILPFGLAGICLVVLMMACNLTLAAGTINGVLFYANILVANRATFFPYQEQNVLTVFVSWLGLNLGIATCFYDGMDGFGKTWVQISFEVYLIVLVFVVIALGRNTRVSAFFHNYKLNPVHTLATLIMLSYEKLSRRIFSLLAFTHLKYPTGTVTVWLFDPNLNYMEGKHISLAIVASLIIILGSIFTFILLFSKCLVAKSRSVYFNNFMEAFHAPLKPNHQYWVGLLLLARNLSYLNSEFINAGGNPAYNLHFVFTIVVGLLIMKFFISSFSNFNPSSGSSARNDYSRFDDLSLTIREDINTPGPQNNASGIVYKNSFIDLLETSFLANIAVLSYFTLYIRYEDGDQPVLFYVSSSAVLLALLGILIYHACVYTCISKLLKQDENRHESDNLCTSYESYSTLQSSRNSTKSEVSVT